MKNNKLKSCDSYSWIIHCLMKTFIHRILVDQSLTLQPRRKVWTPITVLIPRHWHPIGSGVLVKDISISVMLEQEAVTIKPVIEHLAPFDVPPNAPERFITQRQKMLVADQLVIQTLDLERSVVRPRWWSLLRGLSKNEGVVVAIILP